MITRIFFLIFFILVVEGISFSADALKGCGMITISRLQSEFMNMNIQFPTDAIIRRDTKNDTIVSLQGKNLSAELDKNMEFQRFQSEKQFADIALAFLSAYHRMFNLINPPDELNVESVKIDELEMKHIRFKQMFHDIPVWGSEIIVHLNVSNQVNRVEGRYIPTPESIDIKPVLTHEDAFRKVIENLGIKETICPNCQSELVIFLSSSEKYPYLAYRVMTKLNLTEGWLFFIDAKTGNIIEKITTVQTEKLEIGGLNIRGTNGSF